MSTDPEHVGLAELLADMRHAERILERLKSLPPEERDLDYDLTFRVATRTGQELADRDAMCAAR